MAGASIVTLTDANFQQEISQASEPILVDFWAEWCGPCRMIAPVVEEVAEELDGKIKIGKLNVDENTKVPADLGVMSIPTLILFKDGVVVNRIVGYQTKEQLLKMIQSSL